MRDIYLKYRQARQNEGKTHSMTIWARGELKERMGLSDVELSRQLTRMSLDLFVRHRK